MRSTQLLFLDAMNQRLMYVRIRNAMQRGPLVAALLNGSGKLMNGMTRNLCKTYISEILFKEGLSINQSVPNSKGSVGFDSVVPPNFSVSSMTFAKGRRRMLSCRHRNTR